jgi:hypothetical protein
MRFGGKNALTDLPSSMRAIASPQNAGSRRAEVGGMAWSELDLDHMDFACGTLKEPSRAYDHAAGGRS